MGKSKIKIQKIEKDSNRRVTFNKRRIGLLKKAYEISILCDVDIALIFFSQNGELTCFEGPRSSAEEVVMKFANTSEHERAKSHIQKYTTSEDQLRKTMPRKIENEEMFQQVARKLYQSHPGLTSLSECERSIQMDLFHRASLQEISKEIKDVRRILGLYDLNLPIGALISSSKDAAQMEFYVQRQLQRLENLKQLPQIISSELPTSWLDSQNDNRTYGQNQNFESISIKQEYNEDVKIENMMLNSLRTLGAESTYMNQELGASCVENDTHALIGWEALSSEMGIFDNGVSSDQIHSTIMGVFDNGVSNDQIHPTILPELSESTSDFLPSSIEDDINAHDFLEDISAHDSLQSMQFM